MAKAEKPQNVTQKIIQAHLAEGTMDPGSPIALVFDQTLCQDATGTLVMLALEAMELDRAKTEVSVQYVDHNLIQEDHKNADDHLFLLSAAQRFGLWYSRPGNGISHPLHMQNFCKPGATLIGSDSHTCAAGCMGMFAMGAGGADVALAIAGKPVNLKMPEVWGVKLTGKLPDWVSAKDVILEMLRRYDVDGGVGRAIEYYGPGLASLSAMDRHVIANMGAELGATATVFPSDDEIRRYMDSESRGDQWQALEADEGCQYDHHSEINLSELEPLIARPSSPGNVVPVSEVAGEPMYQAYIGSSANPGFRDFAMVAEIIKDRRVPQNVSLDINPTSRKTLQMLADSGYLSELISAGARLHQAGCNGCIGMGQAPATEQNSLRTTPRNFPGRSGTLEDKVWLCSPETAAASALTGVITDPRTLPDTQGIPYPTLQPAQEPRGFKTELLAPKPEGSERVPLVKGPNVAALPDLAPMPNTIEVPVLLNVGDDISTDEIMPAGAEVLPFRSNIPRIAEFTFRSVDKNYVNKARDLKEAGGHAIVAGENYGQGSSREHAALAPRYLGLQVVLAKSFARIHKQNLINYGVLPLTFDRADDYQRLIAGGTEDQAVIIRLDDVHRQLESGAPHMEATAQLADGQQIKLLLKHNFYKQQVLMLLAGSITNWLKHSA